MKNAEDPSATVIVQDNDETTAENPAINDACKKPGAEHLTNHDIYILVSLCPMCPDALLSHTTQSKSSTSPLVKIMFFTKTIANISSLAYFMRNTQSLPESTAGQYLSKNMKTPSRVDQRWQKPNSRPCNPVTKPFKRMVLRFLPCFLKKLHKDIRLMTIPVSGCPGRHTL